MTLTSALGAVLKGFHVLLAAILIWVHMLFGGATLQTSPKTPSPTPSPTTHATTSTPVATSTPVRSATQKEKPVAPTSSAIPIPTPTVPAPDPTALNEQTRAAVVNILCTLSTNDSVRTTSGSGVFIDSRGIILTNAHVAQYFLLKDYPQSGATYCTIRTGSPAQPSYTATLMYLPPAWVAQNASQIALQEAYGTGENDYAFLLVTGSPSSASLPATFPTLPMSSRVPKLETPVLLSAYAAGFFGGTTINTNLYNTSTFASVKGYYTFGSTSIDVISVGGSLAAQAGSSGGAVVNANTGDLVALIATETASSTTAGSDLHAITFNYLNRSLEQSGWGGLATFLSQNAALTASEYAANIAPALREQLISALEKH